LGAGAGQQGCRRHLALHGSCMFWAGREARLAGPCWPAVLTGDGWERCLVWCASGPLIALD
jgi:hypothetical protein